VNHGRNFILQERKPRYRGRERYPGVEGGVGGPQHDLNQCPHPTPKWTGHLTSEPSTGSHSLVADRSLARGPPEMGAEPQGQALFLSCSGHIHLCLLWFFAKGGEREKCSWTLIYNFIEA
jgi:hypothetical protein